MPITRTFFADNDTDFGFDIGVIKSYKMETDAELTALFKLPAEVLKSYFESIGSIPAFKKGNETDQVELLKKSYENELLKIKTHRCMEAIEQDKPKLIEELGCNDSN